MKKWLCFVIFFCCLWFSFPASATGQDVATPTVDAILNEADGIEEGEEEENLENPSSDESTEEGDDSTLTTEEGEIYNPMEYIDNEFFNANKTLPEVGSQVTKKGFDILKIVQIVGYIIVTIVFVIALILIAINKGTGGAHSNNVGWGALIICAICYVLIFIGPSLLEWIKSWSVS